MTVCIPGWPCIHPRQAAKLVAPTNFRAVSLGAAVGAATPQSGKGIGVDTEAGVKMWQSRLVDKLGGASPAAVVITGESQEHSQTLQLIVAEYAAAGAGEE